MVLANSEDIGDDVMWGVSLVPERLENLIGFVNVSVHTMCQHLLNEQWVWLITHLSDYCRGKSAQCNVKKANGHLHIAYLVQYLTY